MLVGKATGKVQSKRPLVKVVGKNQKEQHSRRHVQQIPRFYKRPASFVVQADGRQQQRRRNEHLRHVIRIPKLAGKRVCVSYQAVFDHPGHKEKQNQVGHRKELRAQILSDRSVDKRNALHHDERDKDRVRRQGE